MASQDELSALLDDALADFSATARRQPPAGDSSDQAQPGPSHSVGRPGSAASPTLKFDPLRGRKPASRTKTAAPAVESAAVASTGEGADVGLHSLDDDDLSAGLANLLAELAASGPKGDEGPQPSLQVEPQNKDLAATLRALAEQAPAFDDADHGPQDAMFAQLAQQLGSVGVQEGDEDGEPEMGSFVDTIMKQLLSKDVLYEPLVEIGGKYPAWLAEHRETLAPEDLARFEQQHVFIKRILRQYETEPENFGELLDLLQQMQACGQPPKDIVDELAPGQVLGEGLPFFGGSGENPGPADCCIQ